MIVLTRPQIEALLDLPKAACAVEHAYRAASMGRVTLPPVGHITFPPLHADCHIKYGYLEGAETFAIKVATGFPQNAQQGLPTGNGLVLVMSARTGAVEAILHDEMVLTDIRTGLGGAIASRALSRPTAQRLLVVGTGPQAARQIEAHAALLPGLTHIQVWGRDASAARRLVGEITVPADLTMAPDLESAVRHADIMVTATGATAPLIKTEWIRPGTHITAVGADAPGKQELPTDLVAAADILVADLIPQCLNHGEFSHAVHAAKMDASRVTELGTFLHAPDIIQRKTTDISIADLTGIAAQDIAIADLVLATWHAQNP